MGTFFLFTFVLLPLLLGVLSHLWSIIYQKKRHNQFSVELQPLTIPHKPSNILCVEDTRSRLKQARLEMDENQVEQKPMRRKASLLDMEEAHKQSQARAAVSQQTSPTSSPLKKSSSTRTNCLCSPTTHVGSFRCRLHRHGTTKSNNMRRGHSVGSNLSEMATRFSSNPTLATSSLQMSASSSQMQ